MLNIPRPPPGTRKNTAPLKKNFAKTEHPGVRAQQGRDRRRHGGPRKPWQHVLHQQLGAVPEPHAAPDGVLPVERLRERRERGEQARPAGGVGLRLRSPLR